MFQLIFKVLEKDFKTINIFFLVILMAVGSILEIFSIGLIIPLISSLTVSNIENIIFYEQINSIIKINTKGDFFRLILTALIIFFTSKFFFMIFLTLKLNKFIAEANRLIPKRLLNIYLKKNYQWQTNENRSNFIHLIFGEVNSFCANGMYGCLFLLTEFLNIFGIVVVLIFFDIKVFISILILSIFFFPALYFFTKKVSYRLGEKRQQFDHDILKILNENLKGIKEFLIYKRSKVLYESFNQLKTKLARVQFIHDSLQDGSRHIIEFIGIIILISIIIINGSGLIADAKGTIVVLGLYVVAFVRVLPSLNRISTYSQRYRYGLISAEKIISFLQNEKRNNLEILNDIHFLKDIKLINVSFKFEDGKKNVLNDVNIEIKKNNIIGIVGESGSGKTTLTNIIMGLIQPTEGVINVDGKDIISNKFTIQSQIGFVSQNFFALDDTIINNITLGDNKINFSNLRFALKNSLIEKAIKKKQLKLKNKIGELGMKVSGGQLQRINIARALYRRPELLILDEPSSALDMENQHLLTEIIKNLKDKMTIILISHQKKLISNCDKIYKIENGKIIN